MTLYILILTRPFLPQESGYENQTLLLSGDRSISLSELAQILSGVLPGDQNVAVKVVSEDDYVERNLGKQPETLLRPWATTYLALSKRELESVNPLLKSLLGRKLHPIETTLEEMLQADSTNKGRVETERYAK